MIPGQHLQYPIGKEEEQEYFHAAYSDAIKAALLLDLKMLPGLIEMAVQDMDAAQLATLYRPGGWSVNQLVHHVADSHMHAYLRCKWALTEDNTVVKPYDQDAWASLADSELVPINISLTLLHALHVRFYALLGALKEEDWQRTLYHPERKKEISLWDILKSYAWHGKHHSAQITAMKEANGW